MSRVLVDRELLGKWADKLEGADSAGYGWEDSLAAEVRSAIAQPAEAEGVAVVGYAVTWARVGDTPEKTVFMSAADFEAAGGPRFYSYREPLILQSDHLAALSAVTVARDRLQALLDDPEFPPRHARRYIDQIRAEAEALRQSLVECVDSLHAEMLTKFGGQRPEDMHPVTRRDYDRDMAEIAEYRAAMAAKDARHAPSGGVA